MPGRSPKREVTSKKAASAEPAAKRAAASALTQRPNKK